ncbi:MULTISPECIES: terminase small subunit-like protein [unclassified Rhizobium]|uniref:terminase small subunit-like protein n=1 Tax=unclassified Rhizobium TaxID=2613769 RepID=UPI001ADA9F43|nr:MULTISPECIES: terminase small subunit protein [unclassified Rhizobium]MBO9099454.1 terminase small subunit protein [Rhizobium sp. L58/93]QXZ87061.1 terminase small subunit protein [Rhizobium sp. K1/93]QXZ92905.1 terminase small subunit protein [Rhizobium sp. K15/93]
MPAKAQGRPTVYTIELTDVICERIANGESLKGICEDDAMPGKTTVFRWLAADEQFRDKYARAREAQADALFDDILTIADDGQNDWMEKKNADGKNIGWMENGEALRRSALRIDARKWMAGKLRPKVYGDKLDVSVDGKVDFVIGAKPVTEADWLKEHGSKS